MTCSHRPLKLLILADVPFFLFLKGDSSAFLFLVTSLALLLSMSFDLAPSAFLRSVSVLSLYPLCNSILLIDLVQLLCTSTEVYFRTRQHEIKQPLSKLEQESSVEVPILQKYPLAPVSHQRQIPLCRILLPTFVCARLWRLEKRCYCFWWRKMRFFLREQPNFVHVVFSTNTSGYLCWD